MPMNGSNDSETLEGGSGADSIAGNGGDDVIRGGSGADLLLGGQGEDFVRGGNGHDTVFGGQGDDEIHGGNGRDVLSGDKGADVLYGGRGDDTFLFNTQSVDAVDTIKDFEVGDSIALVGDFTNADAIEAGDNVELWADINGTPTLIAVIENANEADVDAVLGPDAYFADMTEFWG